MGILRDMFGPSQNEIWKQFSDTVGGKFSEGGFWLGQGTRVDAAHGQWIVTLDSSGSGVGDTYNQRVHTRLRAPYVNPDGFRFTVHTNGLFSQIGKMLGMQDVTVGYPDFDEAFIIKGNDEAKLRRLFANAKIRSLLPVGSFIQFKVVDKDPSFWGGDRFPMDADELYFETNGLIMDLGELKKFYELFSETLDELCRMGSAYEKNPGVRV